MRRLKAGGLTARVLARLRESPVPVRTSVLAVQLGAHRSALWESLKRLERHGAVARARVVNERLWACYGRGFRSAPVPESAWQFIEGRGK